MSKDFSRDARTANAITGWQQRIRGTNTAVSGTPAIGDISGNLATGNLAGTALSTGTYYYFIPVAGALAVDVTLRTSAATGTGLQSATTIYKTLADGVTEKMNGSGSSAAQSFATFVNGTQQTVDIDDLRGENGILLKIVVPATSTVTFDQAEFSAI